MARDYFRPDHTRGWRDGFRNSVYTTARGLEILLEQKADPNWPKCADCCEPIQKELHKTGNKCRYCTMQDAGLRELARWEGR